jgi:hypothetical protein
VLRRTIVLAGPALAVAALVAPAVLLGDRLPDPLATHWDVGGTPDGRTGWRRSRPAWWPRRPRRGRCSRPRRARAGEGTRLTAAPWVWGAAGVAVAVQAVTVLANRDAATWADAGAVGLWVVPVVLAAGAVPAWIAHLLERRLPVRRVPAGAGGPATVGLGAREHAVWTAHQASPHAAAGAAAAAVLLPVAGFVAGGPLGWLLLGVGLLLAAAIGTVSEVTATVDRRGLTLAHGPVGWPRWTVPLDDIAMAEPTEIDPWRAGGWGIRKVPGRRGALAVVVRGGPGLRVVRADGRELLVTVPDAAAASGLLADLTARGGTSPGARGRPPARTWAPGT